MSYIGENGHFSFRDGFCEEVSGGITGTSEAADIGRAAANLFGSFSIGCDGFSHNHILYAIAGAIAEAGRDAAVCENTDLPSFRFAYPRLSAECGIFVSGRRALKISFFGEGGFPVSDNVLRQIMNGTPAVHAEKSGKITPVTSFRDIYAGNIAASLHGVKLPIPAAVSCGCRCVRELWLRFFTGEDDELVFQLSDDGQRVNAYSSSLGFISHEKLILACAAMLSASGQTVCLPDELHFAADSIPNVRRFSLTGKIPDAAVRQRFLTDTLFMCVHLAWDRERFLRLIRSLPPIYSVRREIAVNINDDMPVGKTVSDSGGRIIITRSGNQRLSLLAQSLSAETASEICSDWSNRLMKTENKSFDWHLR